MPSCYEVCVQGELQKYTCPSPPLTKDEGLKNIVHSMSIRNLFFRVNSVTVSGLICYNSLLQNPTDVITEWNCYFITKRKRSVLQIASRILLQIATVLLQNAIVVTKCDDFITKFESYYKMRLQLQIATAHRAAGKKLAY